MAEENESGNAKKGLMRLILLAGIVVVAAGAGAVAAMLLGGPNRVQAGTEQAGDPVGLDIELTESGDFQYYHFDSVKVNLHTDSMARYVAVTVVLAYKSPQEDSEKETLKEAFESAVKAKKLELVNYIHTYFAGCTLDEVGGDKNRARMQREIRDALNDRLWPEQKPWIDHVLFEEFMVQ